MGQTPVPVNIQESLKDYSRVALPSPKRCQTGFDLLTVNKEKTHWTKDSRNKTHQLDRVHKCAHFPLVSFIEFVWSRSHDITTHQSTCDGESSASGLEALDSFLRREESPWPLLQTKAVWTNNKLQQCLLSQWNSMYQYKLRKSKAAKLCQIVELTA